MRLVARIKIFGNRWARIQSGSQVMVREADGEVTVELEEDGGLRAMIQRAIDSQGRKCKSGPLHVRFLGKVSVREPRPDEVLPRGGRDDVYKDHPWGSRPQ